MPANAIRDRLRYFLLCTITFTICGNQSHAHEIDTAIARVNLQQENTLQIIVRASLETLLTGTANLPVGTDSADHGEGYQRLRALTPAELEREAKAFIPDFIDTISLSTEQGLVPLSFASVFVTANDNPDVMRESELEFTGQLPESTESLTWQWNEKNGPVILRVDSALGEELHSVHLAAGESSSVIAISAGSSWSSTDVIKNYLYSGFIHIVPRGLDHILFVLGLFLFSPRWRSLLLQVSIFTFAHTLTLALGSTGLLTISPSIVEPLIALSIVVVALDNIWLQNIHKFRLLIIFIFGLIHGLGFASVLNDVGLSNTHFVTALLSFNVGVELGQLMVLGLALICVFWCTDKIWYRARIAIPGSIAIAGTGTWWFLQRVV